MSDEEYDYFELRSQMEHTLNYDRGVNPDLAAKVAESYVYDDPLPREFVERQQMQHAPRVQETFVSSRPNLFGDSIASRGMNTYNRELINRLGSNPATEHMPFGQQEQQNAVEEISGRTGHGGTPTFNPNNLLVSSRPSNRRPPSDADTQRALDAIAEALRGP